MAIRTMTTQEHANDSNVETILDYHGHEQFRWIHDYHCPNGKGDNSLHEARLESCLPHCKPCGPLYMETTHVGLVLFTGEHNYHEDSDFYAIVWNVEECRPQEIEYATTRGWTYPNSAKVDATPEVVALYEAYKEEQRRSFCEARDAAEAKTPRVGKTVKVIKGRKVPVGLQGEVFWCGKDKFKRPQYYNPTYVLAPLVYNAPERIGIKVEGVTYWLSASNVEVV